MVAPVPADVEVPTRDADALEAVLLEHALRRAVARERSRLEAVKAELAERDLDRLGDRARAEATAVQRSGHPVAEVRAAERPEEGVRDPDRADDAAVVDDREEMLARVGKAPTLPLGREERLVAEGVERREEVPVLAEECREWLRVGGDGAAKDPLVPQVSRSQ